MGSYRRLSAKFLGCVTDAFAVSRIHLGNVFELPLDDLFRNALYGPGESGVRFISQAKAGERLANNTLPTQVVTFRFSGGDTPSLNRLLADRFFVALPETLQDLCATIRRGRNGQGS